MGIGRLSPSKFLNNRSFGLLIRYDGKSLKVAPELSHTAPLVAAQLPNHVGDDTVNDVDANEVRVHFASAPRDNCIKKQKHTVAQHA